MRQKDNRSRDIIDIIGDVCEKLREECLLTVSTPEGYSHEVPCPRINYVFGNSQYVYDRIAELTKTQHGLDIKYPLIALFTPVNQLRNSPKYYARTEINLLIAVDTRKEWNNEERKVHSFDHRLKPIYEAFLKGLKKDGRIEVPYDGVFPHEYSDNYSYGRYGAYTGDGKQLPDFIDAIDIKKLTLTIKNLKCT